jgi:Peptidase S46.
MLITSASAEEGFWLPQMDSTLYRRLKGMGIELEKGDIYNDKGIPSLSNAIISFNGGCSGVITSPQGLLFTNFHCCSYEIMQCLSKYQNKTEENGFYASSQSKEIHIPNLYVKILIGIKDVSDSIFNITKAKKDVSTEQSITQIIQNRQTRNSTCEYIIKPSFSENKYILYTYQIFSDIRAVFIPPSHIARFGGDTTNWQWPRYSADFALFRIYSNSQNEPAAYSSDNIPYSPSVFIPVTLSGFLENDLSLVMGYPGSGSPLEMSGFLSLMIKDSYPLRSLIYSKKINMIENIIKKDAVFHNPNVSLLQGLKNKKKMWDLLISESNAYSIVSQRQVQEQLILNKIKSDSIKKRIANFQNELNGNYNKMRLYSNAYDIYREGLSSIGILSIGRLVSSILKHLPQDSTTLNSSVTLQKIKSAYAYFDKDIDKCFFIQIMDLYKNVVDSNFQTKSLSNHRTGISQWADTIYSALTFSSLDGLINEIKKDPLKMSKNPVVLLADEIEGTYANKVWPFLPMLSETTKALRARYLESLTKECPDVSFWPEGDGNIRLSFGRIRNYWNNGKWQGYKTIWSDFLSQPKEVIDSTVIPNKGDSGLYSIYEKGNNPSMCFVTTSQTSSGSSGSPILNRKGELIGLNFDRNQSGTVSDLFYNESTFRNIAVDIRYIMFIIRKYTKTDSLITELLQGKCL